MRFLVLVLLIGWGNLFGQIEINKENITIVRDKWGVPHIYAKTDVEAAYGIAWATAEDDFATMQEPMLALKTKLGSIKGKDGAVMDAMAFLLDPYRIVNEKYETDVSPHFKQMLQAFCQAGNDYAAKYPNEVLDKSILPMTPRDLLAGYVFSMGFIANLHYDLIRLFDDKTMIKNYNNLPSGSNAYAVSPKRSANGKTYFIANSHQPLEGYASWYELQVNTQEGWRVHGATFPGGITPFVGVNKHLGWSHTVNFNDWHDVYKLTMHPTEKNKYKFDGEWHDLEVRKVKLKVKVGPVKIPVKQIFYWSKYGPTIKNKEGYFSLRYPAAFVVGQAEQWYNMNKAKNLDEFVTALEMQQIPSTTITYADKTGNIMFVDNGLFPYRNPNYNWDGVLPGDTSATLWEPKFRPMDEQVIVTNPNSGYVFNSNNSAFNCTGPADNPKAEDYDKTMGILEKETGRSIRFQRLMEEKRGRISYQQLKDFKYDLKVPFPIYARTFEDMDLLRTLDPEKYPDIADVIAVIAKWDGGTEITNKQAAVMSFATQYCLKEAMALGRLDINGSYGEEFYYNALKHAKKQLLKHYGTLEPELGEVQKHVRGDVELPIWGLPEVIAQMYTKPYKKGKLKSDLGESFILTAVFNKNGLEKMETINAYGTSAKKDSPHYTDQMQMFVNQQQKTMTFDMGKIYSGAQRIYHPGE